MDQNVTTLLSTLIGGILAIAGGFAANYITGKMSERSEKLVFIRSKIEELYAIMDELHDIDEKSINNLEVFIEGKPNTEISLEELSKLREEYHKLMKKLRLTVHLYLDPIAEEIDENFFTISKNISKILYAVENHESNILVIKKEMIKNNDEAYKNVTDCLASFIKKKGIARI